MSDSPNTGTILLVETEPLVLRFVRMILEKAGFAVLSAGTAAAAIGIEHDFEGRIDLLLTSLQLFGSSGTELAQKLECRRPRMLSMVMSGDHSARKLVMDHGWYFAEKPLSSTVLIDRVSKALSLGNA